MKNGSAGVVLALTFLLGAGSASAQNPSSMTPATPMAAAKSCATCGTIQTIRYVEQKGQGSGAGAVAGGVLGGVVGHQFGSGRGNTVATIAGVGVGAVAGNEVEKTVKKKSYYVVTVRLDNGGTQSVSQGSRPALREGDRVRIDNGGHLAPLGN